MDLRASPGRQVIPSPVAGPRADVTLTLRLLRVADIGVDAGAAAPGSVDRLLSLLVRLAEDFGRAGTGAPSVTRVNTQQRGVETPQKT